MTRDERAAIYDEMNRVISTLHVVDYKTCGLSNFGKPGNYFERQIGRWTKQYLASITKPISEIDYLIEWLPLHIPKSAQNNLISIVHGDFRLDNVIFHQNEPRILAVLDWELSTLGHPLADFSYHCMSWHVEKNQFRGIAGLDLIQLGIPIESEYINRYCARTGLATPDELKSDWNFYISYNMFRIAAILQGIAKRAEIGTASSEQAKASGALARPYAELAWHYAQKFQT